VREAARTAFDERCSTELERCDANELPTEICERVDARCSEGVDG
jgi:hypothetical protein